MWDVDGKRSLSCPQNKIHIQVQNHIHIQNHIQQMQETLPLVPPCCKISISNLKYKRLLALLTYICYKNNIQNIGPVPPCHKISNPKLKYKRLLTLLTYICYKINVQNIGPSTPMSQNIQPKPKIQTPFSTPYLYLL